MLTSPHLVRCLEEWKDVLKVWGASSWYRYCRRQPQSCLAMAKGVSGFNKKKEHQIDPQKQHCTLSSQSQSSLKKLPKLKESIKTTNVTLGIFPACRARLSRSLCQVREHWSAQRYHWLAGGHLLCSCLVFKMNLASEKKELDAHLINKHISNNTHANPVEITNHAISESLHYQYLGFCQDKNIKCSGLFFKHLLKNQLCK